jgi:hypothetical protein
MKKGILILCLCLFCLSTLPAQRLLNCGTKPKSPPIIVDKARLQQQKSYYTAPYQVRLFVHICANDDGTDLAVTNYPALLQYLEKTRAHYASHNVCFSLAGIDTVRNTLLNYCITDDTYTEDRLHNNSVSSCINVFFHTTLNNSNGVSYRGQAYDIPNEYCSIRGTEALDANSSTLTHELGHDFGLYHTFETAMGTEKVARSGVQSNCSSAGDLLCDTEADPNSDAYPMVNYINASCQYTGNKQDTHGNTYDPPIRNLMAYGRDECKDEFTPQQDDRLDYILTSTHAGYLNEDNFTHTSSLTFVNNRIVVSARNTVTIAPSSSSTPSYVLTGACKAKFTAGDYIDLKEGTQFNATASTGLMEVQLNTLCQ